jgi:hypothetical protein
MQSGRSDCVLAKPGLTSLGISLLMPGVEKEAGHCPQVPFSLVSECASLVLGRLCSSFDMHPSFCARAEIHYCGHVMILPEDVVTTGLSRLKSFYYTSCSDSTFETAIGEVQKAESPYLQHKI